MSVHFYKLYRSLPWVCFSRRLCSSISCYRQVPLDVKLWTKSRVSLGRKILKKHATLVCLGLLGWLWINTISSLVLCYYLVYACYQFGGWYIGYIDHGKRSALTVSVTLARCVTYRGTPVWSSFLSKVFIKIPLPPPTWNRSWMVENA